MRFLVGIVEQVLGEELGSFGVDHIHGLSFKLDSFSCVRCTFSRHLNSIFIGKHHDCFRERDIEILLQKVNDISSGTTSETLVDALGGVDGQ